jgi:hypothetical protein
MDADSVDIDGMRAIARMLKDTGYETVEQWASDSGYLYNGDYDEWHDDEGYGVDIQWQACEAAYVAGYFHRGDN